MRCKLPALLIVHFVFLVVGSLAFAKDGSPIEPGPENGGLRLRFTVQSLPRSGEEAFDVRLDVINTTDNKITLRTGWESTESGDVKQYLAAAASIESTPRFAATRGATGFVEERTSPQKEQLLSPQETLTLNWQTAGRFLKSEKQAGRIFAANPTFTEPGLYSVHVTLYVITSTATFRLRSNEQLVSIGGSRRMPKATFGKIQRVTRDRTTADLNLGALDQVIVGDQFEITSKISHWRLTITDASANYSTGKLESFGSIGDSPPATGDDAILVRSSQ